MCHNLSQLRSGCTQFLLIQFIYDGTVKMKRDGATIIIQITWNLLQKCTYFHLLFGLNELIKWRQWRRRRRRQRRRTNVQLSLYPSMSCIVLNINLLQRRRTQPKNAKNMCGTATAAAAPKEEQKKLRWIEFCESTMASITMATFIRFSHKDQEYEFDQHHCLQRM